MDILTSEVHWTPCYRIIPSRFPPISLFEAVADPADLEAVYAIEAMTNDRLRDEAGELSLVPPEDRVSGTGTSAIMAAFTHLNPVGDRFTDGSYGVFYAGLTLATAIAETRHHRTHFLKATDEPAQELDMRVYAVDLDASRVVRIQKEAGPNALLKLDMTKVPNSKGLVAKSIVAPEYVMPYRGTAVFIA